MKYEKPEIRSEVAAIAAVRGGKTSGTPSDVIPNEKTTVGAYEADE